MSTIREALFAFLSAGAAAYDRLADQAFEDGLAQYVEEFGQKVAIPKAARDSILRRLTSFHQPSLLRIHHELTALAVHAPDYEGVGRWFDRNQYRLEQAIGGILWAASEAGYAHAATAADRPLFWNLEGDARHCGMCPSIADGGPYTALTLPCFPADGVTPCGGNCRCWLSAGSPE